MCFLERNIFIAIQIPLMFVGKGPIGDKSALVQVMVWCQKGSKPLIELILISVGNSHRSASPRPTTLEEDRELFVNFSLILCLWFEIQDLRAYNFFDWISNTDINTLHWCTYASTSLNDLTCEVDI